LATEIKVWQVENGVLRPLSTTMSEAGRKERQDLEAWIKTAPEILGQDILLIGEQVSVKSGNLDFLGIDRDGNTVIVELKRDMVPRVALAQAIDYASEIASWDVDKLNEACEKYRNQPLHVCMSECFSDVEIADISFNMAQRIMVVGSELEESLQRMIEWLFDKFGVNINAVLLKYIQTKSGDELIARTVIIPEEVEKEQSQKQQRRIPTSEEPGNYSDEELESRLTKYLTEDRATPKRIREILLPLCLDHEPIKRDEIKDALIANGGISEERLAGLITTTISRELIIKERDYLRQIIKYEKVLERPWEKENYRIAEPYKDLIRSILAKLNAS